MPLGRVARLVLPKTRCSSIIYSLHTRVRTAKIFVFSYFSVFLRVVPVRASMMLERSVKLLSMLCCDIRKLYGSVITRGGHGLQRYKRSSRRQTLAGADGFKGQLACLQQLSRDSSFAHICCYYLFDPFGFLKQSFPHSLFVLCLIACCSVRFFIVSSPSSRKAPTLRSTYVLHLLYRACGTVVSYVVTHYFPAVWLYHRCCYCTTADYC